MPKTEWNEKNMKYAFCFFPLIGILIGGMMFGWLFLCDRLSVGILLRSAGCVAVPILISGGIHLDGFCDTVDALCSHQNQQKKLEILKDPRIGAFGAIGLSLFLLISFGIWSEYDFSVRSASLIGIGYILSRSLSGLAAVCFHPAKSNGLLNTFSAAAQRKAGIAVLIASTGVCIAGMVFLSVPVSLIAVPAILLWVILYRRTAYRQFGGVTGDLAGYFLTGSEFFLLCAVVTAQILK